eukprot:15324828-Alexandrium_andersonii.AAC.1
MFEAGRIKGLSGAFISDLAQDPSKRNVSGPVLSTQTTQGLKYSHSSSHLFTARELFVAHGWPALPGGKYSMRWNPDDLPFKTQ